VKRFFDSLFGRTRPVPSKVERLFAISTAEITLESQLNLKPSDRAGITFRPVESSFFDQLTSELNDLLKISTKDTGTTYETRTDEFGFRWVLLQDPQFEDLVATIHIVSETLVEHQFGEQLLAAVFRFTSAENQPVYWFYSYKRGTFYPFVPSGRERKRDNARELRVSSAMQRELPIEPELERWYPMWGVPF
jgi:hypothetical protein